MSSHANFISFQKGNGLWNSM